MDHHTLLPAWGQAVLPADTLQPGAGLPLDGGSAVVFSGAENPLLGINAEYASASSEYLPPGVGKYMLAATARALIQFGWPPYGGPLEWVAKCHVVRWRKTVDVLYAPEYQSATLRGLTTCASPWACSICAPKISVRRREELRAGIASWEAGGGRVALVTYTLRHKLGDDLGLMLRAMGAARRSLKSGRRAQTIMQSFGLVGSVRSLEVTHGANGWHPHYHELAFLRAGVDPLALQGVLLDVWSAAVVDAGLRDITSRGVDVTMADLTVADYLSKFGHDRVWGLDAEIMLGRLKRAHLKGATPVQLLTAAMAGDIEAAALWLEYAAATKGQRQTVWSNGLRALLGLGKPETDRDVAAAIDGAFSVLLASLTGAQWRVVVANDAIPELVGVAYRGVAADLWQFLADLGVPGADHPADAPAARD